MTTNEPTSAWVLVERNLKGKELIIGIALSNEIAEEFVRRNYTRGCARSCLPYQIVREKKDIP